MSAVDPRALLAGVVTRLPGHAAKRSDEGLSWNPRVAGVTAARGVPPTPACGRSDPRTVRDPSHLRRRASASRDETSRFPRTAASEQRWPAAVHAGRNAIGGPFTKP